MTEEKQECYIEEYCEMMQRLLDLTSGRIKVTFNDDKITYTFCNPHIRINLLDQKASDIVENEIKIYTHNMPIDFVEMAKITNDDKLEVLLTYLLIYIISIIEYANYHDYGYKLLLNNNITKEEQEYANEIGKKVQKEKDFKDSTNFELYRFLTVLHVFLSFIDNSVLKNKEISKKCFSKISEKIDFSKLNQILAKA